MPEFRMKTEAWMTNARGLQKLYAEGETIELTDAQAPSLRLAGMIEPIAAPAPAPEPLADAVAALDDELREERRPGGRTRAVNADRRG